MATSPSEDSNFESPLPSPASPSEPSFSPSTSPDSSLSSPHLQAQPPPLSARSMSASVTTASMTASSTPLGNVNAARRPAPTVSTLGRGGALNPDIAAKMRAFQLSRHGAPPPRPQAPTPAAAASGGPAGSGPTFERPQVTTPGAGPGGIPPGFKLPAGLQRPNAPSFQSSPQLGRAPPVRAPSLAEKRGLRLPGGLPGSGPAPAAPPAGRRQKPTMSLSQMNASNGGDEAQEAPKQQLSALDRYSEFIDKETGSLKFKDKAILNSKGVQFASGQSFNMSLDEVDTMDELGKGNYGTVYKVRHSRPTMRRPGQGLAGNKSTGPMQSKEPPPSPARTQREETAALAPPRGGTTGIVMAMKEIRLELDDAKFAAIIMELDILHRCISPFIVDFYGAFFQEGAVYICMQFMDGGSVDKIYGDGVPEGVLRKITLATTRGLKSLKDEHNIIHRDVKPTNILVNTAGAVKICDFGVSGNLVASIAKTNIGCQSYMAPERISNGGVAQAGANPGGGTYSVQSDIWSLGLTIIECAMGRYPYPPETYDNIFSQLSAIVDGAPPDLPSDQYSEAARNFVAGCLNKIPKLRPTYAMLLQHAWLSSLMKQTHIIEEEEDEEAAEAAEADDAGIGAGEDAIKDKEASILAEEEQWVDKEVGEWVRAQLEKKKRGVLGKKSKPALHAAPLDVASPGLPPDGAGA